MSERSMKMGIVLPSYLYNREREQLADAALRSLASTETVMDKSILLLLVKTGTSDRYTPYLDKLQEKFRTILKTDEECSGTEQTLAYGTQFLFDNYDVETVTWMGDDALFHSFWLWHLEELIKRHPDAKSWSVYRSAYTDVHKTLDETGEDVLVQSICGHGMTFSRKEWEEWGIIWQQGVWNCPHGDTLDLRHVCDRVGERWVSKQSWCQHTGKQGVHVQLWIPEHAVDFIWDGQQ